MTPPAGAEPALLGGAGRREEPHVLAPRSPARTTRAAVDAGRRDRVDELPVGDGIACRRCLDAAKEWAREIEDGAFVVLFDNDVMRENRTSPGGLPGYGKIAALVAGLAALFLAGRRQKAAVR